MCGIIGIYNYKTRLPVDPDLLLQMTSIIKHRGPDWDSTWYEDEFGFGMVRLSIIGGVEANQPIWDNKKNTGIVFNGTIYNFKEINKYLGMTSTSDTVTLLELYNRNGIDGFSRLAGMFSCAIFDRVNRTLVLLRDRFGKKPLFVCETKDGIAFASEIKPLLLTKGMSKTISFESISSFLNFGYMPPDITPYKEISPFPAGTWKKWAGEKKSSGRYWDFPLNEESFSEDRFQPIFEKAVKRRLVSDVPIGIFLSGGMDSNAVLSIAHKLQGGSISGAYTLEIDGSDSEASLAEKTCRHFGIPLTKVHVKPSDIIENIDRLAYISDNLHANPPMFAFDALCTHASGTHKVILSGGGGDELFYGYPTWKADWLFGIWKKMPGFARFLLARGASSLSENFSPHSKVYALKKFTACMENEIIGAHAWWRTIIVGDELRRLNTMFNDQWLQVYRKVFHDASLITDDFKKQTAIADLLLWWKGMGLYQLDSVSMGHGVEIRAPFMDHDLVEWAIRTPSRYLYNPIVSKPFLRAQLSHIIPEWIIKTKKKPFFIPIGKWIQNDLYHYIRETINDSNMIRDGLLNIQPINAMLETHKKSVSDNSFKLLTIMMLIKWYDKIYLKYP